MFGGQALWQGAKAALKTAVLGVVLYATVQQLVPLLLGSGGLSLNQLLGAAGSGAAGLLRWGIAAGVGLAILDVVVVMRRNRKQTRMSLKEVKDENKRSEGDPQLKGAIRSRQFAISRNRMMANRHRHYERWSVSLPGFVAVGDAACAFNPIYGQGMTLAALSALELRSWLRESGNGRLDGHAFHKRIAKLVAAPWALATGEDLRWPATQGGEITARVRFMHWYIDQIMRLIPTSPDIYRRFQLVNHMLAEPETLFHPAILGPVMRQALTPDWGRFLPSLARQKKTTAEPQATTVTLQTRVR